MIAPRFDRQVLKDLKEHQLLHYRGKRARRRTSKQNIPVVITSRFNVQRRSRGPNAQDRVLIPVTRYASFHRQMDERYAVPKFLFINICSLVSETHLRLDVPDAVIAMSNYALYRRDSNWSRRDMRKNGGSAIYISSNIKVIEFELIAITTFLPKGQHMLISGVYHPPDQILFRVWKDYAEIWYACSS